MTWNDEHRSYIVSVMALYQIIAIGKGHLFHFRQCLFLIVSKPKITDFYDVMMIGADYENVQSQLAEPVRERNFFFEFMGSKKAPCPIAEPGEQPRETCEPLPLKGG